MSIIKLIKSYKELGQKEFFAKWKRGISEINPYQQTLAQITFTKQTILGVLIGFAISVWYWKTAWWLAIILGAAFGNTFINLIALKQKKKLLESFYVTEDKNEPKDLENSGNNIH